MSLLFIPDPDTKTWDFSMTDYRALSEWDISRGWHLMVLCSGLFSVRSCMVSLISSNTYFTDGEMMSLVSPSCTDTQLISYATGIPTGVPVPLGLCQLQQ